MKNVVLLIIDSMNYSHMKKNSYLTPFLNGVKKAGLNFENMYSQAPYTEAATMNIYCGQNVLDNNGYIKRFNNAEKTIFEVFKEKGYTTYYNYFQPQCYPSSLRRGIDFPYYDVGFDINALWSYRLYMYSELLTKNQLNSTDISLLKDILDDNFNEWIRFNQHLIQEAEDVNLIIDNCLDYSPEEVLQQVTNEFEKYCKDKEEYIFELLREKTNHRLFKIKTYKQDNKIKDKAFIPKVQEKYYAFFEELQRRNVSLNRKNCKGAFKGSWRKLGELIKHPSILSLKNYAKSLKLALNVYKDADLFERIADDYETFKNAPSIKKHIDHYINWETGREKRCPSFACIHVDDIHNAEMFFTYDTTDMDLIDCEFEDAKDVVEHLPKDYYGNITHDLSLRYIDTKIKYFYEQLKQNHLDDNTIVLICADHGFSFAGNPLRDSFVINMYLENYNIPCIITGAGLNGEYEKLCSSKDIPVLLSFFADGKVPREFTGKLITSGDENYERLFIEYCGGGCPDIQRRKLKIGCFNKNWFVASESDLKTEITKSNITEVYDLRNDPLQLHNLRSRKYCIEEIDELILAINKRKFEIAEYFKASEENGA